jgi:hypothetical protein
MSFMSGGVAILTQEKKAEVTAGEGFDLPEHPAYHGLFVRNGRKSLRSVRPMLLRRGALILLCLTILASVTAVAQKDNKDSKDNKKQSEQQKKEIQAAVGIVDGVAAGQPMQNDLSLTWVRDDLLKAQGNKQYVPFTVALDASKVSGGNVAIYWRVVSKDAPPPSAPAQKDDKDKDKDKNKKPEFAYEDLTMTPLSSQSGTARLSRSFTVSPGSYDVFVVVKEPTPEKKNQPAAKMSVLKQTVDVPDLWNGELNTSSVIIAERIDPLPAPLTPQQQVERPYALGAMEIVPSLDTKFSKKNELSTFLLIYNAKTDAANKPDVSVEYNFYTKQAGGEKFFNKTSPQNLNAQTLPPQFDFAAGHQLQSGQAVPLASFPEGDYRLEIKVIDKLANKSLTRDFNFTVVGS